MTAIDVHWFLDLFDELSIKVWIDGGWGVDALLGQQTREHADLDIIIETPAADVLRKGLQDRGFVDVPTDDRTDWNYVMGGANGKLLVDFHLIDINAAGDGIYGPPENGDVVPASALQGTGTIEDRNVHCLTPEYQVQSHSGYALHATDIADMSALHEKFGVKLLDEQIAAINRN